jgi:NADH:ubiquinone oxidoreductase subunit 2 (subunit N)
MALAGLPALAGFRTKELIILRGLQGGERVLLACMVIGGAIFTVAYRCRIILRVSLEYKEGLMRMRALGIGLSSLVLMLGRVVGGVRLSVMFCD